MRKDIDLFIGIDTGTNTGFAVWNKKLDRLEMVKSMPLFLAMENVSKLNEESNGRLFVRVEDARKRNWFGNSGREQLQGAGSIKRDAVIWEEFLTAKNIQFELVAPKNNKTKMKDSLFRTITGWKELTNVHGRDAAMLVFKAA